MEEHKGYLTVGELAKKMKVSVRTIQYYDQIALLSPTEFTEGGRRLYSVKDYITLYQIISLKEFGFSLKEIKERLLSADTMEDLEKYLVSQENHIQNEITILHRKYELIHKFRKEMKSINKIDWALFVEVLALLRNNDENYWIVKHFDKDVFERVREKYKEEEGRRFFSAMEKLCEEAMKLRREGVPSDSDKAMNLAKAWWSEIMGFTDGDREMIEQMVRLAKEEDPNKSEYMKKFKRIEGYINEALTGYFQKNSKESIDAKGDMGND